METLFSSCRLRAFEQAQKEAKMEELAMERRQQMMMGLVIGSSVVTGSIIRDKQTKTAVKKTEAVLIPMVTRVASIS
jgi:hypothetical protein